MLTFHHPRSVVDRKPVAVLSIQHKVGSQPAPNSVLVVQNHGRTSSATTGSSAAHVEQDPPRMHGQPGPGAHP